MPLPAPPQTFFLLFLLLRTFAFSYAQIAITLDPAAQFPPAMHVGSPFYFPFHRSSFACPPDATFVISGLPPWMDFNLGGLTRTPNGTATTLQAELRADRVPPFPEFSQSQVIMVFMTIIVSNPINSQDAVSSVLELPLVQYPPPTRAIPLADQLSTRITSEVALADAQPAPPIVFLNSATQVLYLPAGALPLDLLIRNDSFTSPLAFNRLLIPPITYTLFDSDSFTVPSWVSFSNNLLLLTPPPLDGGGDQGYFELKLAASNIPGWSNCGAMDSIRIKRGNAPPALINPTALTLNTSSSSDPVLHNLLPYFTDPDSDPMEIMLDPAPGQVFLDTLSVFPNGTLAGVAQRPVILRARAMDVVGSVSADRIDIALNVGGARPLTPSRKCASLLETGASCLSLHVSPRSDFTHDVSMSDLFAPQATSVTLAPDSPDWVTYNQTSSQILGRFPKDEQDPVRITLRATDASTGIAEAQIELRLATSDMVDPQDKVPGRQAQSAVTVSIVTVTLITFFLACFVVVVYVNKSNKAHGQPSSLNNIWPYNRNNKGGGTSGVANVDIPTSVNGSYNSNFPQPHGRYQSSLLSFNSISRPSSMGFPPQRMQYFSNLPQTGVMVIDSPKDDDYTDIGMSEYSTSDSNSCYTSPTNDLKPIQLIETDSAFSVHPEYVSTAPAPQKFATRPSPPSLGNTLPNDSGWIKSPDSTHFPTTQPRHDTSVHAPEPVVVVNTLHQGHIQSPKSPNDSNLRAHAAKYYTDQYSSVSVFYDSEKEAGFHTFEASVLQYTYQTLEASGASKSTEQLANQYPSLDPQTLAAFNNTNDASVSKVVRKPSVRGELLRKCLARVERDRLATQNRSDEEWYSATNNVAPAAGGYVVTSELDTEPTSSDPVYSPSNMTPSSTYSSALTTSRSTSSVDGLNDCVESARTSLMSTATRYGHMRKSVYSPNMYSLPRVSEADEELQTASPHDSLDAADSMAQCLSDLLNQYASSSGNGSENRVSTLTYSESSPYRESIAIVNEYIVPQINTLKRAPVPLPRLQPSVPMSTAPCILVDRPLAATLPNNSVTSLHSYGSMMCDAAVVRNLVAYTGIPFQYILTLPPPPHGAKRGPHPDMRLNMLTRIRRLDNNNPAVPSSSLNHSQVSIVHTQQHVHVLITDSPSGPQPSAKLGMIPELVGFEPTSPCGSFGVPSPEIHEYPVGMSAKQVARMTYPNPYANQLGSCHRSSGDSYGSMDVLPSSPARRSSATSCESGSHQASKLGMLCPMAAATEVLLVPPWLSASVDMGKRSGVLRGTPCPVDVGEWAVEVIVRFEEENAAPSVVSSHVPCLMAREVVVWKAVVRVMAR